MGLIRLFSDYFEYMKLARLGLLALGCTIASLSKLTRLVCLQSVPVLSSGLKPKQNDQYGEVRVCWSHLVMAKEMAVQSRNVAIDIKGELQVVGQETIEVDVQIFHKLYQHSSRYGVEMGEVRTLEQSLPMLDRKYVVVAVKWWITLKKQLHEISYPDVLHIIAGNKQHQMCSTVNELFPPDNMAFMLGRAYHGSSGQVTKVESEDRGMIRLRFEVGEKPDVGEMMARNIVMVSKEECEVVAMEKLEDDYRVMLEGGGHHGGKRSNTGRKAGAGTSNSWKQYKPMSKKDCDKIKKSNKNILQFFRKETAEKEIKVDSDQQVYEKDEIFDEHIKSDISGEEMEGVESKVSSHELLAIINDMQEVNEIFNEHVESDKIDTSIEVQGVKSLDAMEEENNNTRLGIDYLARIIDANKQIFTEERVPYFLNGCFAKQEEKLSVTNYSCAIDSFLALGEAILSCGNVESIAHSIGFSPLLQEILSVLIWRLENEFKWNHALRNPLWQLLASSFPQAITPIGKVTAAVEPAVLELGKLWPITVVTNAVCSEDGCGIFLGSFKFVFEESLILSPPKNCDLKNKNYRLSELFLNRINKHVNNVLRHKVRCSVENCGGLAMHTGIPVENMKIPPFLFLSFLVEGSPSNYYNNFKDSCILEQELKIGKCHLNLLCGLMSSQLHFFSICKMFGRFYKFDNMIQQATARGYQTFKEAYNGKPQNSNETDQFHLSRKSVRPRKGAVYFAVYQGEDLEDLLEENWSQRFESLSSLNDLPNLNFETLQAVIRSDIYENVNNPEFEPTVKKPTGVADILVQSSTSSNILDLEVEKVEDVKMTVDFSEHNSNLTDSNDDCEEENVPIDDNRNCSDSDDSKNGVDTDDEGNEVAMDEVQSVEDHTSKCNIDYRLQTFEDLGRYMRNNPGSFYDHSQNLWFCSVCQHFGGHRSSGRRWVDIGVRLGSRPGRAFKRHFESDFHRKNVEIKKLFGNIKTGEKSKHVLDMLKTFPSKGEENQKIQNREMIKILFRTAHYQIKHMMSNLTYKSLVKLISECGSQELKKFMMKSPKNASYLSLRTFDNILQVLNNFTEEPLLQSLETSNYVTLFHDETTDVSNHSEAAVFVMFYHEGEHREHYLGIMNMSEGQTAEKHYNAILQLCNQKNLSLANVQFSDLDGCNTNTGDMQGLKLYFMYHNPHHLHQVCNSHTLALVPKHKVTDSRFKPVADADKLMITLYVLFKKSSVKLNIFERSQIVLEMKVLKIICPSSTRWLTHEHCFRRIIDVFEAVLVALIQLYQERDDVEALGIVMQLTDPKFVLAALMLTDMLRVISPLTLWLQTSPAKADITELPTAVNLVVDKLKYLVDEDPVKKSKFSETELKNLKFNKETFAEKCIVINNIVESLPAASRLRNSSEVDRIEDQFENFKRSVQQPFVLEVADEIEAKIQVDPVSAAFKCLDVRYLPKVKSDLPLHGIEDIKTLIKHFGQAKEATHPKTLRRNRCDPKIIKNETLQEFEIFKTTAFEINCQRSVDLKQKLIHLKKKLASTLTTIANKSKIKALKSEISELESEVGQMSLSEIYKCLCVPGRAFLFPNILILLELAILCPIGNATVERLFSFLKLVKTKLRNQMGDGTLDSLLRIKVEGKEELEDHDLEHLVNMFKEYQTELSKSGEIRINI